MVMQCLRSCLLLLLASLAVGQPPAPDLLDRLRDAAREAPLVVAHRGASEDHPENTLVALRAAVAAGAQVVEFDVYQTKDGAFVLMHDATCDRTTDAVAKLGRKEVRIDELTLAQVRTLDAGAWKHARFRGERIPTLEEALNAVFPAVPMIERKGGDALALVAELRRLDVVARVLVQAFDWPWLAAVRAAEPGLVLGALGSKELSEARAEAVAASGASFVHWDHRSLTVESAAAVRARGWPLCTYTVDADLVLLGAAALGCDWITTNRPARLAALRERGDLVKVRAGGR